MYNYWDVAPKMQIAKLTKNEEHQSKCLLLFHDNSIQLGSI